MPHSFPTPRSLHFGCGALAAAAEADAGRGAIASRAAPAYIQVLGNEQMLASAQADLGLANDLLTLSRDQQKAGIASGVDVARAETAVAQDRYAVSETETAIAQARSEEHTSELQSLMRISYAVFCLKKKKKIEKNIQT